MASETTSDGAACRMVRVSKDEQFSRDGTMVVTRSVRLFVHPTCVGIEVRVQPHDLWGSLELVQLTDVEAVKLRDALLAAFPVETAKVVAVGGGA